MLPPVEATPVAEKSDDAWGLTGEALTGEAARRLNLSVSGGVLLIDVIPGSPAQKGERCAVLTARATSLPAFTCWAMAPPPWMSITCTWPDTRSCMAGPPPR